MTTPFRASRSARPRALDAYIKLMRASDAVNARLAQGLAPTGVTPPQLAVLEALLHLGPLHACDLGRKLLRSGANVTTVVDNLEKAGLVARERGREDRRYVVVALTASGRRTIQKVFPAHAARIASLLGALTPPELETLARLCKKLGLAAARETGAKAGAKAGGRA
jgi:MarR family transcriptional regulator, 2-MHQ and catechol-resistance regulon repressor